MDLLLEIVSHQRHAMTESQSKYVFKAAGGTIGRNQNNDWSIDDPERLISGQHASIQFEQNQFHILDNSSNGLFINQEQQALGHRHHIISNGDIFLLGQYSIQATLISTHSKAVFSRSTHDSLSESAFNNEPQLSGVVNEYSSSMPLNTSSVNEASIPLFPHELAQNSSQYVDPLSQFNDVTTPGRLLEQDILAEPDAINSVLDPIPSTQSYFDLPSAIPENWLKNDSNNVESKSIRLKSNSAHLNTSQETIQSNSSVNKPSLTINNDISRKFEETNVNKNIPQVNIVGNFEEFKKDFNFHNPNEVTMSDASNLLSSSKQLDDNIAKQSNNQTHDNQELINTLLKNIGINLDEVSPEQLPELIKNIGLITKTSMSGIMKTMMSRAHLKNEFRMSMTTIQTQENNPLKFCINYEQLVHYMLVKPMSGYLNSEQAIVESFDELQEHQVGIMAGMKSALNYMIDKLSPEKIKEKTDRVKSKTLALSSRKSRYWEAYNELYKDIKNEDDVFTTLFGNEFCKAYERQIEDIRQARK